MPRHQHQYPQPVQHRAPLEVDLDFGEFDTGALQKRSAPKELEARLKNYSFKSRGPMLQIEPSRDMASRFRVASSPVNAGGAIMSGPPLAFNRTQYEQRRTTITPMKKKQSLSRSQSVPAFGGQVRHRGPGASDIGRPHRVEAPAYMNIPPRIAFQKPSEDDSKNEKNEKSLFKRKALMAVQDCAYRANACRRAGRAKAEASAYLAMGIHYDNTGEYIKACRCYIQVVQTLEGLVEDVSVTTLAYNSIAVSLYNAGPMYWEQAIQYNQMHLDNAGTEGKFSAFSNLGLVFSAKGDKERSADCHKDALRCALKLKSVQKQAIAIGNLGLTSYKHQDFVTAEACMERHLQLSKTLNDVKGQAVATQVLGEIANRKRNFGKATGYFHESMQLNKKADDTKSANNAKVNLGVALAQAKMEDYMQNAADMFKS